MKLVATAPIGVIIPRTREYIVHPIAADGDSARVKGDYEA
jgi:hypothetical protein